MNFCRKNLFTATIPHQLPERAFHFGFPRRTRCFVSFRLFPPIPSHQSAVFLIAKLANSGGLFSCVNTSSRKSFYVCVCVQTPLKEGGRGGCHVKSPSSRGDRAQFARASPSQLLYLLIGWTKELTTTSPGAHLTHNPARNHPERS